LEATRRVSQIPFTSTLMGVPRRHRHHPGMLVGGFGFLNGAWVEGRWRFESNETREIGWDHCQRWMGFKNNGVAVVVFTFLRWHYIVKTSTSELKLLDMTRHTMTGGRSDMLELKRYIKLKRLNPTQLKELELGCWKPGVRVQRRRSRGVMDLLDIYLRKISK